MRTFTSSALIALLLCATPFQQDDGLPLIRRTEYGVPHIQANDFRGIGIGLGYTQVEDYGYRVIHGLIRAKGWMGRTFGRDSMNSDFAAMREQARVRETYHLLDASTRGVYEGFAEGVNIYIRSHPDRVPSWVKPVFHGHDAAALDINTATTTAARQLVLAQLQRDSARGRDTSRDSVIQPEVNPDDGSNAWALAPSRTKSGRAILLRNPHLAWSSGYWEAHVTIPGKLDFYGDFRIGSAFAVIGGFNENLGFATTNNATDNDEVYALEADTTLTDYYIFDGVSVPLQKEDVTVEYVAANGTQLETRTFWTTPLGPVAHRTPQHIYIVRSANDGDYRAGEESLRMMLAKNLAEWKAAIAMQARPTSNFTYADKAGNIYYVWNGSVPRVPHPYGGDSVAIPARGSSDIWTSIIPFDSLPQLLNPKGGYVHNENNSPWYSNLNAILDTAKYPSYIERPSFGLRPQHAVQLLDNNKKFTLEDIVKLKHSMRMLLADRVKDDLLRAVRAQPRDTSVMAAARLLEKWDNTVAAESRGGLLFETWWRRYSGQARDSAYAERWTPAKVATTPRGLGRPDLAVEALVWSIADMQRRYRAIDVAWGEIHRVRRGDVDVPVGGCSGTVGCFRVLTYAQQPDGKRVANSGDGWVLAVEFGKTVPRAYSVLAYGQSPDPASPYHADQAAMFARGEMKTVRFTEADIAAHVVRTYRPGRN